MGKPKHKKKKIEKNPEVPEKDSKLPSSLLGRAPHRSSFPSQVEPSQFKLFLLVSAHHMPPWTELQMRSGKLYSLETFFFLNAIIFSITTAAIPVTRKVGMVSEKKNSEDKRGRNT